MGTRFAVISLWAEDLPRTAHFYRDVLGLRLLPHHGERVHFDVGGVYLVIQHGRPTAAAAPGAQPFPLFALQVDDLDASVKLLEAHQVPMPWGIESDPRSSWVKFYDPGGNLVELVRFNPGG